MSETNCYFKNTVVVVRHDKNIKMFVVTDQIKSASQPEECRGFVILPYTLYVYKKFGENCKNIGSVSCQCGP